MLYQDKQKGRRTSWTRGVFGMFVVVCLNLALQPCAMAMGTEQDRDCPHCPPSETQGHHGHHGVTAEELDQALCASDDCGLGDDLTYDGRNTLPKLKDLPVDAPVAISNPIPLAAPVRVVDVRGECSPRSPPPNSFPPLNILYCVYLD